MTQQTTLTYDHCLVAYLSAPSRDTFYRLMHAAPAGWLDTVIDEGWPHVQALYAWQHDAGWAWADLAPHIK